MGCWEKTLYWVTQYYIFLTLKYNIGISFKLFESGYGNTKNMHYTELPFKMC